MDTICQHCYERIVGNGYRVISEEAGIVMLNLIVCFHCSLEAKRLGLNTNAILHRSKRGSTRRDRISHGSRLGA